MKELHVSMPGPGMTFDNNDDPHYKAFRAGTHAGRGFSLSQQQMWLAPVASTLRSLSMNSPRVLVSNHDGSIKFQTACTPKIFHSLSLSGKRTRDVRKIALPNPIPRIPTKDFYRLLPRSLQTLEIHYILTKIYFMIPHHHYKVYHVEDIPAGRGVPKDPMKFTLIESVTLTKRMACKIDLGGSLRSGT